LLRKNKARKRGRDGGEVPHAEARACFESLGRTEQRNTLGLKSLGYLLKKLRRPEDFMTVALLSLENKMKEARKWAVFQSWSCRGGAGKLAAREYWSGCRAR